MDLDIPKNAHHYILGAGKIGSRLYSILRDSGIDSSCITVWDKHPHAVKHFGHLSKVDITPSPEQLSNRNLLNGILYITVYAHEVSEDIFTEYKDSGFGKIVYQRSYFSELFKRECTFREQNHLPAHSLFTCFTCPSRRQGDSASCPVFDSRYGPSQPHDSSRKQLVFDTLGLLVTTSCNLTCVGCNHLRDHFEPKDNVTYNSADLIESVSTLSESVDFIRSLVIVGGESFLHPELARILKHCKSLNNVGYIQIITNGGVLPRDQAVWNELSDPRVIVEISGYGDKNSPKARSNRADLMNLLTKHNIMYRYDEATSWIDFGDFSSRGYTDAELDRVYSNCCFVSNDILDGKLFKCSRSAYGMHTSLIPGDRDDYIDLVGLSKMPPEKRRGIVNNFLSSIPRACNHCDGTNPKLIPAGIQVKNNG